MADVAEIDLRNARPHPGQLRVLESFAKYEVTVLSPGRQFGKSSIRPFAIIDQIARRPGFVTGCYMGPAHSDAKKAFEEDLFNLGRAGLIKDHGGDDQDRHIDFFPIHRDFPKYDDGVQHETACVCQECAEVRSIHADLAGGKSEGGRVYYASGGPDAHRLFQKHKLHFAILDEFSHIAFEAWEETVEPMFNTTDGHALIMGTPIPAGINFTGFADTFSMGDKESDSYDPGYNSISGVSEESPYANIAKIAKSRARLAKRGRHALAACLYDGRFCTDIGAVFQNLNNVFVLKPLRISDQFWISRPPNPNESVVVSIDFGRHDDSTVVSAISRVTMEQLALQRIQNTEYPTQMPMIHDFVRRFPKRQIWAEGREEMAADTLRLMYGDSCALVKWSASGKWAKNSSVARGMDLFDRAAWKLLDVPFQREEFRLFARDRLPSGVWKYGAPTGKHDDSVAAVLYATYGLPVVLPSVKAEMKKKPANEFSAAYLFQEQKAERTSPFVIRKA